MVTFHIYIYIHINWEVEPLNTSNHQGSDSWQPYFLWGVAPLTLLTKTSQGVAAPLVLVLCLKIMGNRATDSLLKIRDLRITSNEGVFRFRRNEIISVHKWSAFGMPLMIFPAENDVFVDLVNNPIDHQPLANLGEWRKTYHAVKLQSLPALPVHDPRRRSNHDES